MLPSIEQTQPVHTAVIPQVVLTPAFPPLSAAPDPPANPASPPRSAARIVLTWAAFGLLAAAVITATTLWSASLRTPQSMADTVRSAGPRLTLPPIATPLVTASAEATVVAATTPAATPPPPAGPVVVAPAVGPAAPAPRVVPRRAPRVVQRRVVVAPAPPAAAPVVPQAPAAAPTPAPRTPAPSTTRCTARDDTCDTVTRPTKRTRHSSDDYYDDPWGYDDWS